MKKYAIIALSTICFETLKFEFKKKHLDAIKYLISLHPYGSSLIKSL